MHLVAKQDGEIEQLLIGDTQVEFVIFLSLQGPTEGTAFVVSVD